MNIFQVVALIPEYTDACACTLALEVLEWLSRNLFHTKMREVGLVGLVVAFRQVVSVDSRLRSQTYQVGGRQINIFRSTTLLLSVSLNSLTEFSFLSSPFVRLHGSNEIC